MSSPATAFSSICRIPDLPLRYRWAGSDWNRYQSAAYRNRAPLGGQAVPAHRASQFEFFTTISTSHLDDISDFAPCRRPRSTPHSLVDSICSHPNHRPSTTITKTPRFQTVVLQPTSRPSNRRRKSVGGADLLSSAWGSPGRALTPAKLSYGCGSHFCRVQIWHRTLPWPGTVACFDSFCVAYKGKPAL